MKMICLLGAFLVLFLAVRPCCDDRPDVSTLTAIDCSHPDAKADGCVSCSPFFGCCSGITIVPTAGTVHAEPIPRILQNEPVDTYIQPDLEEVCTLIWQPPKLAVSLPS